MNAASVMTKDIQKLTLKDTMHDAIRIISERKVRQIPVVDSENRAVGVITPRTLMRAILPSYISEGLLEDVRFAPELPEFAERIDGLADKKVEDVLEKDFVTAGPETHTMELAAMFINIKKPIESILIVDDQKRLLGIISPWDIFKRLWEYAGKKNQ